MQIIKFYTFEELKDQHIGKAGTTARENFEAEVETTLNVPAPTANFTIQGLAPITLVQQTPNWKNI